MRCSITRASPAASATGFSRSSAIPDEPGTHPELVLRVRQFLDYQERARAHAARVAAQRTSFQ